MLSFGAQCKNPETEADNCNSAIVNLNIFTCVFLNVTCKNIFCEKVFQGHEPNSPKLKAVINVISYTCMFPTVTQKKVSVAVVRLS